MNASYVWAKLCLIVQANLGLRGSGKSHLLMALAQELIVMRERRMHFTKCSLLMQDLLAAKRDLRLSREIKRLGRFEGLVIYDRGYIQQSREDIGRGVHAAGETLRAGRRGDDQQPAVLEMGRDLQKTR